MKLYKLLSSNISLILLALLYVLLFINFSYAGTIDRTIAGSVGLFIGSLIPPMCLMLIFTRFYKWPMRKQVTVWLIFAYCFQIFSRVPGLQTPVGILGILTILTWLIVKIFIREKNVHSKIQESKVI